MHSITRNQSQTKWACITSEKEFDKETTALDTAQETHDASEDRIERRSSQVQVQNVRYLASNTHPSSNRNSPSPRALSKDIPTAPKLEPKVLSPMLVAWAHESRRQHLTINELLHQHSNVLYALPLFVF